MASLRQLVCRQDYEVAERIEDRLEAGGDPRLEVTELRCSRCGKTRRVVKGEPLPVGQGESRYGWMRRR